MKKIWVFNKRIIPVAFLFAVFLYLTVDCASENDWGMFAGALYITLIVVFGYLILPVVICFTEDEIIIYYGIGMKDVIPKNRIRNIYVVYRRTGNDYCISYPHTSKKAFFKDGEIPKTRKIKKLLKQFYKKDID